MKAVQQKNAEADKTMVQRPSVVINLLNRFVHFPFTSLFIFRSLS